MGLFDWLFHKRPPIQADLGSATSKRRSSEEPVKPSGVWTMPKTEFIEIPGRKFFGECVRSPDQRYTLAWSDANESGSQGGARSQGKGKYIVLAGKDVIAQGAVARPNDGKIANDGNFILNDWGFGGSLQGVFLAFDRSGKPLVKRRFEANLFNNGISVDGSTATCQTANAYEGEDASKLTIFNLRTGVEVGSWIPASGWADFYAFPADGVIQLGYSKLGLFSYGWDGTFLDAEKWQEARLSKGDYSTVMMAVEFAIKSGDQLADGLADRLLKSLERISGQIPAADIQRKAMLEKLQGQCWEAKGDLAVALTAYDAALAINPKVGIRRRADQIRKQQQARIR
jgi:hypothetical protein